MKVTIVPYSVKGNLDGTISLKLAKGANRSELIPLEGIDSDIDKHVEQYCDPADYMNDVELAEKHLKLIDELYLTKHGFVSVIMPVKEKETRIASGAEIENQDSMDTVIIGGKEVQVSYTGEQAKGDEDVKAE